MPLRADVQFAIEKMLELGLLTEDGCREFSRVMRSLDTLKESLGAGAASPARTGKRGRKPRQETAPRRRVRRKRGKLTISDAEFAKLYQEKTAKEMAAQLGVSPGTVAVKASKLGLKKRRGRKAAKK